MKIIIIGASGFLGTKLMKSLSREHEVIGTYFKTKKEGLYFLDASNKEETRNFLIKYRPDVVIDTVALTSSVQCENNPELAEKLNYVTAKNISEICREIGCWMVFMSSSYLFDGEKGNYNENDKISPINYYARTKIMAEKEVLKNPKSLILRVDIMYGYNGKMKKNGVFDMILSENSINLRQPDQIRQPVFVDDIPKIIIALISKNQKGIFHLAGPDIMKMIDFLRGLEKIIRKNTLIGISKEISEQKFPKIPLNATFDISKIKNLGINFTSFDRGLNAIKQQIQEEQR